jgi:hypothetical protein
MPSRPALGVAFALTVLGLATAFACSDYVPPDVPSYGPPNALGQKQPALPSAGADSGGGTVTPPPTGDGGTPTGGEGGTVPQVAVLCVTSGGTIVDGGPCAVSWKTDIFPKMAAGAAWGCAGAAPCHATTAPVLTGDEHTVWLAMANFADTRNNNVPYINPCSTSADPTKSSFLCDTLATGACGDTMPLGVGVPDAGQIAAWVACGSPEN